MTGRRSTRTGQSRLERGTPGPRDVFIAGLSLHGYWTFEVRGADAHPCRDGEFGGGDRMDAWTMPEVDQWLDWVHQRHNEFDYRYIYLAYLAARSGEPRHDEITMTVDSDGGVLLRAGGDDRGLRLVDEEERNFFVAHLQRRYCGDRHPSMRQWEEAQHEDYLEEARWRFGG
jgi:hypothetical protein